MDEQEISKIKLMSEIEVTKAESADFVRVLQDSIAQLISHIEEVEKPWAIPPSPINPTHGDEIRHKIHCFMADFHRRNRYPATMDEIAAGVGLASRSLVKHHLGILIEEGKLTGIPKSPRTLVLGERDEQH